MTPSPAISVIIAVFNGADTLQRAIDSVLGQQFDQWELIVMDGGSTDGTVEILRQNTRHIHHWESAADRGIYHAWNKALAHASGDWSYFLGADDFLWNERVFSDIQQTLVATPEDISLVYGRVHVVALDGRIVSTHGVPWRRRDFLQVMSIPHQGTFHRQSFFERYGRFDESFAIAGDYELMLRDLKTGQAAFLPQVIVAGMQVGGLSSDAANSLRALMEIRRARTKNHVSNAQPLWYWTMLKAYLRWSVSAFVGPVWAARVTNVYRRMTGRRPV